MVHKQQHFFSQGCILFIAFCFLLVVERGTPPYQTRGGSVRRKGQREMETQKKYKRRDVFGREYLSVAPCSMSVTLRDGQQA